MRDSSSVFDVQPSGRPLIVEIREFAAKLPTDIGPMFGRDVIQLCNEVEREIDSLERALGVERANRKWAFRQIRDWWLGIPRDTSDPAAALRDLDRVEAMLDG